MGLFTIKRAKEKKNMQVRVFQLGILKLLETRLKFTEHYTFYVLFVFEGEGRVPVWDTGPAYKHIYS